MKIFKKLDAFKSMEHEGWKTQSIVTNYHDHFQDITSQTIPAFFDVIQVKSGMKILDIATGPGYVAGAFSKKGANAVGLDISLGMINKAHQNYPEVIFLQGDAEVLPFADDTFNAITMNFGLLHLPNPETALKESYRVLKQKGKIAFTVWATPEKAVGFNIIMNAIKTYGDIEVDLPPAPPFFRFSDEKESKKVLEKIGFVNATVTDVSQLWQLNNPNELFTAFYTGGVRMGALLKAQTKNNIEAIKAEILTYPN